MKRRLKKKGNRGEEKGKKELAKTIALQMKKKGLDVALIMELTGLSKGIISRLQ